jgi:hypothetical protein
LFADRLSGPLGAVQKFNLYVFLRRPTKSYDEIQTGVHLA